VKLRACALVCIAGCSQIFGLDPPQRKPRDDARLDDSLDADTVSDMADARRCPPAPAGCVGFQCSSSSSCYYACGTSTMGKQNFAGAKVACSTGGLGCAMTIDDQAENDCIAQFTMPVFPNALVWIGYEQAPASVEPAGGWQWVCRTSNYVEPSWGGFEPNDSNASEDCATMIAGGHWVDVDCAGTARYVCELP